jgi:hypothetical protein
METHPFKRRELQHHKVNACLAKVDRSSYELTISDPQTQLPLTQRMLFADSRRDAVRQFSDWLDLHFPKHA